MKIKPDTIDYFVTGGKIKVKTLKGMLQNGYQKKPHSNVDGYEIDKDLSGQRAQVYYNKDTNHAVISHRGTKGIHDMFTDVQLMFGHKKNKRFDHGRKVTDQAIKKYHDANVTVVGHSLGHAIAQEANKDHKKEQVTLNGAITPMDLLKKQQDHEFVIRSKHDPVSALHAFKSGQNKQNTKTIKSKSLNLLNEHKTDILDRMDSDDEIGNDF